MRLKTKSYLAKRKTKLTDDKMTEAKEKLEKLGLTKAEQLMIFNNAPTSAVELNLIINEFERRFEDGGEQILEICSTFAPEE
ncbi:hypothetical protein BC829DRAFT_217713 [Chytridium lagenaria]|nr:hypothetical protein BC829DRAFT_217713 [Chytridium lagenaria]